MVTPLPTQYPHHLYVHHTTQAQRLENGDFQPGNDWWIHHSMCREETNGKGTEIATADLRTYRFSSLLQLPRDTARVKEGTEVIVTDYFIGPSPTDEDIREMTELGAIRIRGKCAKYDVGRLHCRLWL